MSQSRQQPAIEQRQRAPVFSLLPECAGRGANVIRQAGEGIAVSVTEGAGKAVITGNVFDKMATGAIFGHDHDKIVSGDMAKHGNQGYANVMVERNNVL